MVIGSNWIHLRSSRDARRRFIGAYFVAIRDTSLIFYEFFLNEMCFFTIMIIWFLFVEMFKYTLKCGSLQNKIWYYSALVPKYLPSEASIPGPSLVIVVAVSCRSSVCSLITLQSNFLTSIAMVERNDKPCQNPIIQSQRVLWALSEIRVIVDSPQLPWWRRALPNSTETITVALIRQVRVIMVCIYAFKNTHLRVQGF